MELQSTVQKVIHEVESLTGCPVSVSQDATLRTMAVLDVARGPVRLHRIRIHPNFRHESAYLTCFECGFILRKFAVPPENRVDFASDPKGRREVEKSIHDHLAAKRLPPDVLRGLCDQLYDGLMMQMISIPTSMRVDSWIVGRFPELGDQQKSMVGRQLQDALASLKPEVKNFAPDGVIRPSLAINAAYALFWGRLWDEPLTSMPYRTAKLGVQGGRLLELFDTIPSDPAQDVALVDAWAGELGLDRLFRWVPYRLDES
jgi:hypothetical protein